MDPRNFFAELKRRNVYKVAVAYAVVAWLLLQAASILFPTFDAPGWVMKVVVAVIALGFPIALVIAWAFEMTPQGMRRTEDVSPNEHISQWSRRKFAALIIGLALAAVGLLMFQFTRWNPASNTPTEHVVDKSIAVLPFTSLSEDKANAYFAEGIQDEILTRLAKIDDLKVISRTSTQRYKSSPENLREIAKQLGVEHVVEGSVQKSGEQVRVNVQLINAATDAHLWAEVYDRKVADLFAVQSEIAETIAKALQVKLSHREQRAVKANLTDNPEAYDAYLRGLALWNDLSFSPEILQQIAEFYGRAVHLDPKFAVAWANLSAIQTLIYAEFDPAAGRLVEAKRSVDTAFNLQPDLGDAHFALGLYRYRGLHDYDGALQEFERAVEHGVNKAMSTEFSAYVKRRQGKWDEVLALHAQSEKLDPRNTIIFSERAVTYHGLRRFAEAQALLDRALEITPNDARLFAQKAELFQAEGDLDSAERLLEHVPVNAQELPLVARHYNQSIYRRRFGDIIRILEGVLAKPGSLPPHLVATYSAQLGFARMCAGDSEGGKRDLLQARDKFDAIRQRSDDDEAYADRLVVIDALLRDKPRVEADAARLQRAITRDAFYGPRLEGAIAAARAQLGEADAAIEILQRLLQKPGDECLTPALLRLDPIWDPLRKDPRFEKLCVGQQR